MKKFQVISLFPAMMEGVFASSMMYKAQHNGLVELSTIDLREFGLGPRRQVDDTPYGGGDGMLLKPEPLYAAVEYAKTRDPSARVLLKHGRRSMQPVKRAISLFVAATKAMMSALCALWTQSCVWAIMC